MGIMFFAVLILILLIVLIPRSLKVVPQSKAMVVFNLGRLKKVCGPGIHLVMPFIEMGQFVNLGRQTVELKSQKVPLLDSSPVSTTSITAYRITDPGKAIQNVADYETSLKILTETHLRGHCSEITLTELLTERPKLQDRILESLKSVSSKWGIQVDDFTINFVDVPEEVQNELRRKAEAERLRRLMSEN
jgi:regulator of protease activity HflC (stomatin/prohibitin superfamily)